MSMTSISRASNTIHISLLRVLGQGGFGKVFLAEMTTNNGFTQRVAVKVLHSEYQHSSKLLSRLVDEARMLGVLNHRNIVKVHDVCEVDGQAAIIMEYVEGHSLSELLKMSPVPWGETWQIIADCAMALTAAFEAAHPVHGTPLQLIHRDIKPSNVLLSTSGTVKLLDFGIAKMNGVRESKTSTHQMGTERYMAPEQWMENQSSSAVDVYSLGRTALELMYGKMLPRPPLERALYNQTIVELIQDLPSEGIPHVLADTARELLWSMLSYDPLDRPAIADVADRALALSEAMGVVSLRGLVTARLMKETGVESSNCIQQINIPQSVEVSTVTHDANRQPTAEEAEEAARPPTQTEIKHVSLYLAVFVCLLVGWFAYASSGDSVAPSMQEDIGQAAVQVATPKINVENVEPENTDRASTQIVAPKRTVRASKQIAHPNVPSSRPKPTPVHQVVISSLPLGALVFVDGKPIGRTLLHNVELTHGRHRLEMVFGDNRIEHTVEVTEDVRFVWRPNAQDGVEEWSSFTP